MTVGVAESFVEPAISQAIARRRGGRRLTISAQSQREYDLVRHYRRERPWSGLGSLDRPAMGSEGNGHDRRPWR
jgi:hypothetical protein